MTALIIADGNGRVTSWDAEAELLLGYTAEEMIGQLLGETLVPARYHDQHERGMEDFRTTGTGPALGKRLQVAAMRKDGTEIPVDLRITQLSVAPPTFLGFIDRRVPLGTDPTMSWSGTQHQEYAAGAETERAGRAEALADVVRGTAADVEAIRTERAEGLAAKDEAVRVQRAEGLAGQDAHRSASAEAERIRRATDLAIEAHDTKLQAAMVAKHVAEMVVEIRHLRNAAERMESDIKNICKALDISAEVQRSFGIDQVSPRERAWFPVLIQWFGTLLRNVADSGKTGIELLNEVVEQRADRLHMSKTGLLVIGGLAPFLVALFSIIIARVVGGGH